ncbi:MAG: hypothetical protein JWM11_2179 [Planctomycetaceae bacterium]|nr:hypothetical protein [Planctomycetaceae bacterium]
MLRFFSGGPPTADSLSRREWLRIGGLAGLHWGLLGKNPRSGLAMPGTTSAVPGFGRARSVILVYTSGGQSQLETWDPKPDAPLEIRGEFNAIRTSVPGTYLSEHLPLLAGMADRYAIIRSVSHDDLDHGSAGYLALTGQFHPTKSSNPPVRPNDMPTYGAVLKRVRTHGRFPFEAVHVNGPALVPETVGPGQDGGFLGSAYDPLLLGDVSSSPIAVPCLDSQSELPSVRIASRENLKSELEAACRELERGRNLPDAHFRDLDQAYQHAYNLLSSVRHRQAFDLSAETVAVRDRYGRHRPGQACLMARRLVEAGVPLITVIWNHSNRGQDKSPEATDEYGWDTHNDIFDALKTRLLPRFDQGFSALLEDLEQRGLLDQTLVVCMGEFGRAPQVALEKRFAGSSPGRKHWANVYSIVMAGAGIRPGTVYGASDRIAGYPQAQRVEPGDIAATLFSALGINPAGHYQDAFARPYPIATGKVIEGLY